MEDCSSNVDDLAFDVDVEIPNSSDMQMVARYAEREKQRLEAETVDSIRVLDAAPERVVMESVPDDDQPSSDDEEDAVKTWCEQAPEGLAIQKTAVDEASGGEDMDDGDEEKQAPRKTPKDDAKMKNPSAASKATREVNEPPTINVQAPEKIDAAETLELAGFVHAYIEGTIVVKGLSHSRALDLQSLLCLEDRTTLGIICDTFGSVTEPHYLVYVTAPAAIVSSHGELAQLIDKKVFAVSSESTFALADGEMAKALAGLSFMQPLENDESGDDFSDDDSIPETSPAWLRTVSWRRQAKLKGDFLGGGHYSDTSHCDALALHFCAGNRNATHKPAASPKEVVNALFLAAFNAISESNQVTWAVNARPLRRKITLLLRRA